MNAKEARQQSLQNQLDREGALKQIKSATELGYTSCVFNSKQLKDSAAMELIQDGYKISKHTDPIIGAEHYKADW